MYCCTHMYKYMNIYTYSYIHTILSYKGVYISMYVTHITHIHNIYTQTWCSRDMSQIFKNALFDLLEIICLIEILHIRRRYVQLVVGRKIFIIVVIW